MRVCGRLTAGHVLGGALPGDIVLGSVCIPVGMTPADFDRLHAGGRHRGLVRAVQADARHGIDERDEWREAALRHMGHARAYEIDSAIEWAWDKGQEQRESEDVEEDSMPHNESGGSEPDPVPVTAPQVATSTANESGGSEPDPAPQTATSVAPLPKPREVSDNAAGYRQAMRWARWNVRENAGGLECKHDDASEWGYCGLVEMAVIGEDIAAVAFIKRFGREIPVRPNRSVRSDFFFRDRARECRAGHVGGTRGARRDRHGACVV